MVVAVTGAGLVWWWLSLGAEHCRCHRMTLVLGLLSPGVVDVVVAVVQWMVVVAGLSLLLLGDARAGGVVVVIVVSMDRRWWWPGHRHHRWVMLRLGSLSLSLACNSGCCRLGWLVCCRWHAIDGGGGWHPLGWGCCCHRWAGVVDSHVIG